MSAAGSDAPGEDLWQPKVNPWIIAVAVSLAAFMEVLDTSIANVALPHTQPWASSPVSSIARRVRRRLAADGAGHPGR